MANGNGGPPPPGQKPPMKKSTRNWLIIGAFAVAGGVIWYVMRNKSQTATAGQTQDPNIDPNTGIPYSQEGGYGAAGTAPSLYGYFDPASGQFISGAGAGGVGTTVLAPSTNAEWAQQAEAYLTGLGYNPLTVGTALGKYLAGLPLTANQKNIVEAAIGFFGQPPQGAPPIQSAPPTGQGGGGSTGKVTVPNVVGHKVSDAEQIITTAGLVPKLLMEGLGNLRPGSINPFPGPTAESRRRRRHRRPPQPGKVGTIIFQFPVAGTRVTKGSTVNIVAFG